MRLRILAHDRGTLLPSDPAIILRNDIHCDIASLSLYLSYRWGAGG